MNGTNKIILNRETIMDALEFWLKSKIMKDEEFDVMSIRPINTGMNTFGEYEIEILGRSPEHKDKPNN